MELTITNIILYVEGLLFNLSFLQTSVTIAGRRTPAQTCINKVEISRITSESQNLNNKKRKVNKYNPNTKLLVKRRNIQKESRNPNILSKNRELAKTGPPAPFDESYYGRV
jgi:signal recognition particle subunit SEC65